METSKDSAICFLNIDLHCVYVSILMAWLGFSSQWHCSSENMIIYVFLLTWFSPQFSDVLHCFLCHASRWWYNVALSFLILVMFAVTMICSKIGWCLPCCRGEGAGSMKTCELCKNSCTSNSVETISSTLICFCPIWSCCNSNVDSDDYSDRQSIDTSWAVDYLKSLQMQIHVWNGTSQYSCIHALYPCWSLL